MQALSWIQLKGDKGIWIIIFLLSLISLLAVYSSSNILNVRFGENSTEFYFLKHSILLGVGLVSMYFIHRMDYRIFAKLSNILMAVSLVLLAYTLFQPVENEVNQASRWVRIFGQSFQPSDLAKFSIVIFVAKWLALQQSVIKDFRKGFLPILVFVLAICGFIAPANLSTALLIFSACFALMFVSGVQSKYLLSLVLIGIIGLFLLFKYSSRRETWEKRAKEYYLRVTNPEASPHYQTIQSNIAIAGGGIIGRGAGKSVQRNFLPHPYSDFIYAIIIEEYGLLGGLFVLGLYLFLLIRTVAVVTVSRTFGALLATGLAFMIVFQALVNMGVTVGILPVTGLPLPLISMGGTSVIFTCMSLGIILSVSRTAIEQKKIQERETDPEARFGMA